MAKVCSVGRFTFGSDCKYRQNARKTTHPNPLNQLRDFVVLGVRFTLRVEDGGRFTVMGSGPPGRRVSCATHVWMSFNPSGEKTACCTPFIIGHRAGAG